MAEENRNFPLEIAKSIGEPINIKLPTPVEIQAIANVDTADPGERVWRKTDVDNDADYILNVDSDGKITTVKKSPIGETLLSFTGLNSRLEHVLVDDVINGFDLDVLARKKVKIANGMDKAELKILIDGIEADTNVPDNQGVQSYTVASADDLYDVILGMKHLVEDYGDNYTLLVGSAVKEAIDTYDKDNVGTFNYNIGLTGVLNRLGIEVMKVFGQVDRGSGETALMNTNHLILVAKNSRIAPGKPIDFIRRRITPAIASQMGAEVDSAQRALIVNPVPVQKEISGTHYNVLAYGVYGYESVVFAISNPLAICTADATVIM